MGALRFHVDPRDVPPYAAARRLGLTEAAFSERLPALLTRGFPRADATTGHFDLDAIDAWRKRRHSDLFHDPTQARDGSVALARLKAAGTNG